jgi:PAS domain S-box-containing protein/putative nucleotidyltransferase with HDIG domain
LPRRRISNRPGAWLFSLALLFVIAVPVAHAQDVRIGVLAHRGAAEAQATWGPTAEYLNRRMPGTRFSIVPLGFKELPVAVEAGKVEFVIANSSVYVEQELRFGVQALATLRSRVGEHWTTRFGGVVITRADTPEIAALADLKGRSFMAVEQSSLGGFHAAWRELSRAGLDPYRDFSILRFGGTHDAVALAVRDKLVDAGTLRTDILERMAREGVIDLKDFRVLNPQQHPDFPYLCSTTLYPEWPIAKVRHAPDDLARRVATVLITMPPQSEAALRSQSAGWTDPAEYGEVRELMRELRIGPFGDEALSFAGALRAYAPFVTLLVSAVLILVAATWHVARLNRRLRRADVALRQARDELTHNVEARTSELSAALAELEESKRREALTSRDWHDAFDAITDPIFIHDRTGRLVHANPAYLSRAGMTAEAVLGLPYWEVFPRLAEPLVSCREFAHEQTGVGVSELRLDNGEVFVSRSFGIRGAEGARHAIHILEDVTAERRAEAERRMLSHAVGQAGEGVVVTASDGHITYANPALGRLVGSTPADLREMPLRNLFIPADRKRVDDLVPGLSGSGWSGELSLQALEGPPVPVFATGSAFYGEAGTGGFIFTLMDLRSIKAAEQALTYRLAFESVVGAIAARFVAVDVTRFDAEMNSALARIGASVLAERAYLLRYDAEHGELSATHEWCSGGIDDHRDRLQALKVRELPWIAQRMARFEAMHVPDVLDMPDDAAHERDFLKAVGVRSLLMVPLASGDSMLGILGFDTATAPKAWPSEDVRLLRAVGEVVANTLRRLEAEAAVRRSEESLAQAQRVAHLGNWDWNIVDNGLAWSDEIYRIFGLQPQEFGATYPAFLERVHPDDRAYVQEEVNKALRRERDYSIDHRIVLPDGSERIVHEKAMVLWDADGKPQRMIGTVQDVTAARHAELELRRLNRALRTLSRGNETLVRADNERDLLRDICTILVDVGGYRLAWVGYAEQDAERTITPVAHAGQEAEFLTAGTMCWADGAAGRTPAGIAMRSGEPYIARDVTNETGLGAWRERALESGFASVIALPLRAEGGTLGALVIDAAEADAFDDAEVRLLRELADDLAFGVVTLRSRLLREKAEQELKRSERRYHELYDNAPAAYMSVRAQDGAIVQANAATVRLFGYSRDELLGMKVFEFYAPGEDGLERARALFERLRTGEQIRDQEVRMLRRDGQPVWVSLSVEPVRDTEGNVIESRASLLNISARKRMEEEKTRIGQQLQKALVQTIEAIALTIEKRDPYTAGHQTRVAQLAVAIGEELGLDAHRLQGVRLGAQIHDIGKIYVPAEFLNRPGQLTEPEFDIIRSHPLMGYDIVEGIEFPWPVAQMVVQHHERLDGSGYPHNLKGEEISLEARIIAVADVVEAMASHRPYRAALPLDKALAEIESGMGVRYDTLAADACLRLFRENRFNWDTAPHLPSSDADGKVNLAS